MTQRSSPARITPARITAAAKYSQPAAWAVPAPALPFPNVPCPALPFTALHFSSLPFPALPFCVFPFPGLPKHKLTLACCLPCPLPHAALLWVPLPHITCLVKPKAENQNGQPGWDSTWSNGVQTASGIVGILGVSQLVCPENSLPLARSPRLMCAAQPERKSAHLID